ncbi:formylglycine-generating enzyme family protein [Thioflexithrix psekupsensis]|uniref:formylglycine-generating enzyme family protein n=1 Tax=Thioflexithrix psekupsensis TaxID=1570016 RepID=UPI001594083B|nr:SUMF1/EgtB/PvdO family nonheme iron enzyme [Thioflexithrix psekupsensis]
MASQAQAPSAIDSEALRSRLQTCQIHFEADRLLTGQPGTAYQCYKSILEKYPKQSDAVAGLAAIAQRYEVWIRQAVHDQRPDKAKRYVQRLEVVAPDYPQLTELKEKIAKISSSTPSTSAREKTDTTITSTTVPRYTTVWQESVTGIRFVKIPAGCYTIGSQEAEEGRYPDEYSRSEVCLDAFWLGETEVTNAQYRKFVAAHDSRNYLQRTLNDDEQPVVFVSWDEAVAFADWLTQQYDGKFRFRLPSEAEWEYAARAGANASRFWGDDPHLACQFANVLDEITLSTNPFSSWAGDKNWHRCQDGFSVTAPVKQFQANAFGLYDTLGNVWEWTCSAYLNEEITRELALQCTSSSETMTRVIKGGGWSFRVHFIRSAMRYPEKMNSRNHYTGFRVLKEFVPQE